MNSLPFQPDYGTSLEVDDGVLRDEMDGGRTYHRLVRPPRRVWSLVWESLSYADYATLANFIRANLLTPFKWTDPSLASREFALEFLGRISARYAGNENQPASVMVREAVGTVPDTVPTTPLHSGGLMRTVGNSRIFIYGGYGYKVTATGVSAVLLDGVDQAGALEKYTGIALALHKLELQGATPPTVSLMQYVW